MKRAGRIWKDYLDLWKRLTGRKRFFFYLLHYTVLFVILQYGVFSAFYIAKKTFMWRADGIPSYFAGGLVYLSQTVRDGIQKLIAGEGWQFPLYDFRKGVMKPNLEIEPIQWLAVFWPWDKIDTLYDILTLLRYYLIGVSFSLLGFYFGQKPLSIAIGAISYTFCGFSIYAGVRHPQFMAPMIFLPLLVIGAERVLKGERAWLFTGVVFLSLISSLYFSCMLAILIGIYIFTRYLCVYSKDGIRGAVSLVGRMALWGGAGILLGGAVWVPTLIQMMGTGRVGRDVTILAKYATAFYEKCLTGFVLIPGDLGSWTCLGFPILAVPAVLLLLFDKRKATNSLKAIFFILTIMVCTPIVSYVMSGFNTYSNRWIFAYALCVAAVLMVELPLLSAADRKLLAIVGLGTVAYIFLCYFVVRRSYYYEEPLVLLFLAMSVIAICYFAGSWGTSKLLPVCLIITCLSVNYSAFIMYSPEQRNYVKEFASKGEPYAALEAGQYTSLAHCEEVQKDDSLFYVSGNAAQRAELNSSYYSTLNGLSYFSSGMYESYRSLKDVFEVGQRYTNNIDLGLDGRMPLLSFANVKYYALRETGTEIWPYGMREIARVKNEKNTDIILKNDYALTAGYTYDSYINLQELLELPALQRQEVMTQAVVLDSTPMRIQAVHADKLEKNATQIPSEIICSEGISWDGSKLKVTQENATLELTFRGSKNSDTYVRVVNLNVTKRFALRVNAKDTETETWFTSKGFTYDHGARTQLVYLGNAPEGYTSCTLTFPVKGTFTLDGLEIWCQPMDHYAEQIKALRTEPLKNVETNWRGLTGTTSTTKDKFLCFSIPYDKGWTVYVDGEKADLVQANIGFMGVELSAGDHTIELKYWPPGMTLGAVFSCVGLVGGAALSLWAKKKKVGGHS